MYYITGLAILTTVFIVVSPLIDQILNENVLNILNNTITYIEYFLGSEQINYFLIIFTLIIFMYIVRYINSFIAEGTDR